MANENDTFIREVNEQIRSERLSNFWGRYGIVVVGSAVLIVLGLPVQVSTNIGIPAVHPTPAISSLQP